MLKENRIQTLIKVEAEEAFTSLDAHVSQDEASYNGNVSDADKEDTEVVPDEVDNTQMEGLKPVEADTAADKEVPEATNKEDGSQTSKSTDKKPAQKHSNRASSGTRDGPVYYNRDILTDGHKDK